MRLADLPTRDYEHARWLLDRGHLSDARLADLLEPVPAADLEARGGLVAWLVGNGSVPDAVAAMLPTDALSPAGEVTVRDGGFGPVVPETATAVADHARGALDTGMRDTILPGGSPPALDADLKRIGRYLVDEVLGRGGMGVVYKALDPDLQRTVALKILGVASRDDRESIDRFFREARTAGSLRHPGIIAVHEVGTFEGTPFVAMEYIEGVPLWEKVRSAAPETWPLRDRVAMFRDVCRAVQHAHEHGIVHRDLKSSNIMLRPDGRPVVLDFGLARHLQSAERLTATGAFLGTPGYMPPEQLSGERQAVGTHTDVFALGVILYETLSGKLPFQGDSPASTVAITLSGHYAPLRRANPRIHPDLETICARCLELEGSRRYAHAGGLADDIDRFLANEPIHARPIGRARRAMLWLQRRRGAAAGAAFALALVLALAAAAVWSWTRPAWLRLRVRPPGARVTVAGREVTVGEERMTLEVPPGDLTVRAAAPGWKPLLAEERRLERNETRDVVLELERETGIAVIDAFPPQGVEVDPVDGAVPYMNLKTRKVELRLPTGRHEVVVGREGHYRERVQFELARDATVERRVTFRRALLWRVTAMDWGGAGPSGDLDGDGIADLLTQSFFDVLLYSGRTGELRLKQTIQTPGSSLAVALDVTGDGAPEWLTCRWSAERQPELACLSALRTNELKPLWTVPVEGVLTLKRYRELRGGTPRFCRPGPAIAEADPAPGVAGEDDLSRGSGPYADVFLVRTEGDLDGDGADDLLALFEGGELRGYSGRTGARLWARPLPEPCWRMARWGGRLVLTTDRRILALDGRNGEVAWETALATPTWLGPWADGRDVLLGVGDALMRLDAETGKPGAPVEGSPLPDRSRLACRAGGLLLQDGADGQVAAWSLSDGRQRWRRDVDLEVSDARPIDLGGRLGVAGRIRDGSALRAFLVDDGAPAWSLSGRVGAWWSLEGNALLVTGGSTVRRVNAATGTVAWTVELPAPVSATVPAVDLDADGVPEMLFGTEAGHFVALGPDGRERFSAQVGAPVRGIHTAHLDYDGLRDFLLWLPDGSAALRAPKVIWRRKFDRQMRATPVLHDVNGDRVPDAIFPLLDTGTDWPVLAVSGRDGGTLWEERHSLDMARPVALADFGGDGRPEVVTWNKDAHALRLLDAATGARVTEVTVPAFGYAEPVTGDLDADGVDDALVLGWYENAAYAAVSGRTRAILWQGKADVPAWSGARLQDIDGDGAPEAFFVTRIGGVFALRGRTGEVLWRHELRDAAAATMAGVGLVRFTPEEGWTVVVSGGDKRLHLLDAASGKVRKVIAGAGGTASRPAFADADGDGVPEIVVGGEEGVACIDRTGRALWMCRAGTVGGDPVIADLHGDGESEVVFGNVGGLLYCVALKTGRALWAWSAAPEEGTEGDDAARQQGRDFLEASPALADFDGDGVLDVLVASHNGTLTCVSGRGRLGK